MVYLITSVIIFNSIAYFIPKRLSKLEILTTSIFAMFFSRMIDIFLDIKSHLYWYFTKGVDWFTLIPLFGTYPAISIVYLNYFPSGSTMTKKLLYVIYWSIFAVAYEWGAVYIGNFLHYGTWKLWYSAILYPIIFSILIGYLILIRKLKDG